MGIVREGARGFGEPERVRGGFRHLRPIGGGQERVPKGLELRHLQIQRGRELPVRRSLAAQILGGDETPLDLLHGVLPPLELRLASDAPPARARPGKGLGVRLLLAGEGCPQRAQRGC